MSLIQELANGTTKLDKINYSLLVLVPKKLDPNNIHDYQPICLLNCTIKITKILANCLKLVLRDLIDDSQIGFIIGSVEA